MGPSGAGAVAFAWAALIATTLTAMADVEGHRLQGELDGLANVPGHAGQQADVPPHAVRALAAGLPDARAIREQAG